MDHVQDALGEARLDGEPAQDGRRGRGVLGRFEDHGVAPGQGRGDLPGLQHQREVPGGDGHHDTGRLEPAVGVVTGVHRQRVGDGHLGVVGEEPEVLRGPRDIVTALRQRLAHVAAVRAGQLVGVRLHQVAQPVQQLLAAAVAHPGPGTVVKGPARATECDLRPGLSGPRVDRLEAGTVGRLDLLAVDDVAEERGFAHDGPAFLCSCGGDPV